MLSPPEGNGNQDSEQLAVLTPEPLTYVNRHPDLICYTNVVKFKISAMSSLSQIHPDFQLVAAKISEETAHFQSCQCWSELSTRMAAEHHTAALMTTPIATEASVNSFRGLSEILVFSLPKSSINSYVP